MTSDELLKTINSLNVTTDQLATFLGAGMASLEIDSLKNKIAKLRVDQAAYNSDIESQVQEIQAQINTLEANIVKAA